MPDFTLILIIGLIIGLNVLLFFDIMHSAVILKFTFPDVRACLKMKKQTVIASETKQSAMRKRIL